LERAQPYGGVGYTNSCTLAYAVGMWCKLQNPRKLSLVFGEILSKKLIIETATSLYIYGGTWACDLKVSA